MVYTGALRALVRKDVGVRVPLAAQGTILRLAVHKAECDAARYRLVPVQASL